MISQKQIKKIKNKVSIEVYDNGCAVTIKRGKENLGAKVFEGKDSVKRYIHEQEGKKLFEYDIYECPEELKGQLKIGDFYG